MLGIRGDGKCVGFLFSCQEIFSITTLLSPMYALVKRNLWLSKTTHTNIKTGIKQHISRFTRTPPATSVICSSPWERT